MSHTRPSVPTAARNTPAPDPHPDDQPDNAPGSSSYDVATRAPGGVEGMEIPSWAIALVGLGIGLSVVDFALGMSRRNK